EIDAKEHRLPGAIGIVDADVPRTSAAAWPARDEIATEVDEECLRGQRGDTRRGPIDRILLADAAEIDLHAGGHRERRAGPDDAVPAHTRERLPDRRCARHVIAAVERPDPTQHARGDVEPPLRRL